VNDSAYGNVPLSQLPADEKAKRAASFGAAASHYERYRPGPPPAAVDWVVPQHVGRIVDLGAGTGALTRLLTDRADEVVAVEPDDRMRAVLASEVPAARAVGGRGESIPLPDGFADAVIASSSWHWMDPLPTLHEVGRVLVPGGVLAALWSGPDPEGAFIDQARALLAQRPQGAGDTEAADAILTDTDRPLPTLEILPGVPFEAPEHEIFRWDVALTADDLIGLLGTLSWVITMEPDVRERILTSARRLLAELLGVEGDVTVDVGFRCDVWRSARQV
jgi:SAM-dependent methyltransferase